MKKSLVSMIVTVVFLTQCALDIAADPCQFTTQNGPLCIAKRTPYVPCVQSGYQPSDDIYHCQCLAGTVFLTCDAEDVVWQVVYWEVNIDPQGNCINVPFPPRLVTCTMCDVDANCEHLAKNDCLPDMLLATSKTIE